MRYVITFTVHGSGAFPFDMLRYDACWPDDTADAVRLGLSIESPGYLEPRSVTLKKYSDVPNSRRGRPAPTVDRWSSFGWRVDLDTITERKL